MEPSQNKEPGRALHTKIQAWFYSNARFLASPEALLDGFCQKLNNLGLEVSRANLTFIAEQPQLEMQAYIWSQTSPNEVTVEVENRKKVISTEVGLFSGGKVETVSLGLGNSKDPTWIKSPFRVSLLLDTPIRRRLLESMTPRDFPILLDLDQQGVTDYFVLPLKLPGNQQAALSITTSSAKGFLAADLIDFELCAPTIAFGFAHHLVQRADSAILAAYIGKDPARRVLAGAVQVGDTKEMEAVVGFADLRGFTSFSSKASSQDVVLRLNTFFSAVQNSVTSHGGEVMKFIGDGCMFTFLIGDRKVSDVCLDALKAVQDLHENLLEGHDKKANLKLPYRFATALHLGRVIYGNIGSAKRLDFTVFGSTVNETARMELIAKKLEQELLVSKLFADSCPAPFVSVGQYPLRGLPGNSEVFIPS